MYQVGQQFETKVKKTDGDIMTFVVVITNISDDNVMTLKSVHTHFNGTLNELHNGGGSFNYLTSRIKINDDGAIETVENWKYEY